MDTIDNVYLIKETSQTFERRLRQEPDGDYAHTSKAMTPGKERRLRHGPGRHGFPAHFAYGALVKCAGTRAGQTAQKVGKPTGGHHAKRTMMFRVFAPVLCARKAGFFWEPQPRP